MLRIDPTNMKELEQKALSDCLAYHYDTGIFFADTVLTYSVYDDDKKITLNKKIILNKSLIKRQCRPGGKHDGEFRFEIAGGYLGKGSFAKVFKTLGVIVPPIKSELAYFKEKLRVCKSLELAPPFSTDLEDTRTKIENVLREYLLTPTHMHMKPPTYSDNRAFLFMRYIKGYTLEDLIFSDFINIISNKLRLSLCEAIADALQHQVHDHQLIHRDFKPANIMVDFDDDNQKWIVTTIDFGLSKKASEEMTDIEKQYLAGTPLFASPEAGLFQGISQKSDVYSLAVVSGEIFNSDRNKLIKTFPAMVDEWQSKEICTFNLFNNLLKAGELPQEEIKNFISCMGNHNGNIRPTATRVAEKFKFFQSKVTTVSKPSNDDTLERTKHPEKLNTKDEDVRECESEVHKLAV